MSSKVGARVSVGKHLATVAFEGPVPPTKGQLQAEGDPILSNLRYMAWCHMG